MTNIKKDYFQSRYGLDNPKNEGISTNKLLSALKHLSINFIDFIIPELYKGFKYVLKLSLIFLFLSMFVYNLEYQEFSGDYTKITKKSCMVQVVTFNELIKDYFIGDR